MPNPQQLNDIEDLLSNDNKEGALQKYKALMQNDQNQYDAWVNYSSFLFRCSQYEDAIETAKKSITLQPSAEGFHNLGACYEKTNKLNKAVKAYKEALRLNPKIAQTQNDLALAIEKTGNINIAIDHYQTATTLSPDTSIYWQNLARARQSANRHKESLSALRLAYETSDDKRSVLPLYADLFNATQDFEINEQLISEVIECQNTPNIEKANLTRILQKIYLHKSLTLDLTPRGDLLNTKDFEQVLDDKAINWAELNTPDFLNMLALYPIRDQVVEQRLTTIRAHCLYQLSTDNTGETLWKNALLFLNALSCQCYFNEYLFFETPSEKDTLKTLERRVIDGQNITLYDIVIYSCYRPLHRLPRAQDLLKKLSSIEAVKNLTKIQLAEPLEEEKLKEQIQTKTSIDDDISQLVKEQYEQNPYPRWIGLTNGESLPFKGVIQYLLPHVEDERFTHIDNVKTRTLIAGCGTGQQSINTSQVFEKSDILAVDLSATSIAYAARKTKEYKINNIEYALGDILKLEELNEQFDVIQCGGVLHHMKDPQSGWRVLNNCLKPGGFMLIALYSETARQSVIAAREFITQKGFKSNPDGIRACRRAIQNLPETHPVKPVMSWVDFYSTSACRDLILHVQECQYTALKLKESIDELNLEFLGFNLQRTNALAKYIQQFPDDPNGLNLENWHEFEQLNPATFGGMYQMWLQKPFE